MLSSAASRHVMTYYNIFFAFRLLILCTAPLFDDEENECQSLATTFYPTSPKKEKGSMNHPRTVQLIERDGFLSHFVLYAASLYWFRRMLVLIYHMYCVCLFDQQMFSVESTNACEIYVFFVEIATAHGYGRY